MKARKVNRLAENYVSLQLQEDFNMNPPLMFNYTETYR